MKLKEKIKNNDAFILIKSLWDNKRSRSILWLGLYFIFFFVIITSLRNDYNSYKEQSPSLESYADTVLTEIGTLEQYSYELLLNGENIINGKIKNNSNTFVYNGKDYIIVGDNVYLEKNSDLIKVDLTIIEEMIIPLNKIIINNIKQYIKDLVPIEAVAKDDILEIKYEVSLNKILDLSEGTFNMIFYKKDNIEKIEIDLSDYAVRNNLNYDKYIIEIKLGEVEK